MIRQARAMLATLLAFAAGATALAQERPSFDCAKADNPIDRAICKNGELAKADREMAAAYTALLAKVSGAAKDRAGQGPGGLDRQSQSRLPRRSRQHRGLPEEPLRGAHQEPAGLRQGTYPAISEQSLAKQGKLGKITWSYDLTYPRFEGANADFAAVNARFADAAKKAIADESTPKADDGPEREQQWTTSRASRRAAAGRAGRNHRREVRQLQRRRARLRRDPLHPGRPAHGQGGGHRGRVRGGRTNGSRS